MWLREGLTSIRRHSASNGSQVQRCRQRLQPRLTGSKPLVKGLCLKRLSRMSTKTLMALPTHHTTRRSQTPSMKVTLCSPAPYRMIRCRHCAMAWSLRPSIRSTTVVLGTMMGRRMTLQAPPAPRMCSTAHMIRRQTCSEPMHRSMSTVISNGGVELS